MIKYLYQNNNQKSLINLTEHKIINDSTLNKFFIRSAVVDSKEILIIDNHYKFFVINKKNIEDHLHIFNEKTLLGKSLQLKEFLYSKPNFFKINFFIGNRASTLTSVTYLKTLFLIKKNLKQNLSLNWPLLLINKGNFIYFFFGLKGFLPRKNFSQLRKVLKKLKQYLTIKQKFAILVNKYKKLILRTLLLKNLKANKLFLNKSKYKNQLNKASSFSKIKKINLKSKK